MTLKILAKCFRRIFFDSPRVLRNSTPELYHKAILQKLTVNLVIYRLSFSHVILKIKMSLHTANSLVLLFEWLFGFPIGFNVNRKIMTSTDDITRSNIAI